MSQMPLDNIEKLEDSLRAAADNLRANANVPSSEYCMPVLGIIFLRHATNRYDAASLQINEDQVGGRMPKRARVKGDFLKRRALMLPEEARYDYLLPASDCMMNPSVRPITVRSLWRLYSSHG